MGTNVSFLMGGMAVQAVPRLAEKRGIVLGLPPERMLYGMGLADLVGVLSSYDESLRRMVAEHDISWKEVYEESDVGRERMALIEEIGPTREDIILDVGCGKGFTTIALAFDSSMVCGLDLMNGFGRLGWWDNFRLEMASLGLQEHVSGVRGSAAEIPYRDGGFTLAVSAHALRNFDSRSTIVSALREMGRATRRGGRVVVAENLPVANSKAQEAHLRYFELKTRVVKTDSPYCSEDELTGMFEEAGLEVARREVLDFDLSAAPPFFVLDPEKVPSQERKDIVEEYRLACEMIREHGEASPPVLLLEAYI
ncbi:MAG: methyltransferase domain-containing protein [Candidatus Bathyarchaeota archaeon]|nr:methyltransferase domain-containing protein [Candidatus Bathyarchaeota archaeon]